MQVPFINLNRIVDDIKDDVAHDWQESLEKTEFVGGPSVAKLERSLEDYLGVHHFIGCSSGTDALVVSLMALGVGRGMRVAIPNLTFWAPFEAAVLVAAEPVLVDIDPDDLQMDFEEFKKAHERFRFDAAILVHLYGWTSARLEEYRSYCKEHDIMLIEDGAQAFGVQNGTEGIYSGATISTISFYPAKVIGASGDGGGIMTCDVKLAEKVRALCNHGRAGHYTYDYVGMNSRLGAPIAKFLLRMVAKKDEILSTRRQAEAYYIDQFEKAAGYKIYKAPQGVSSNGYLNVMTADGFSGNDVVGALSKKGVGAARTYPQTLDDQPPAKRALRASDLSRSKDFCNKVFNLPIFAKITPEEFEYAALALKEVSGDIL